MRRKHLGFLVAGLVLFGSGTVVSVQWQGGENTLSMCEGAVQEGPLRELLGDEPMVADDGDSATDAGEAADLAHCSAESSDGAQKLTVEVGTSQAATRILHLSRHDRLWSSVSAASPLGEGVPAAMTTMTPDSHVTMRLRCSSGRHQEILVDVGHGIYSGDTRKYDRARDRARFARAAAAIAEGVSRKEKCGAEIAPGKVVVPADFSAEEAEPLDRATGTCRPLRPLADEAEKWGIRRAVGSPAFSTAPMQDCLLLDGNGRKVYRLSALYGHLADAYRQSQLDGRRSGRADGGGEAGGWAWASSGCPDGEPSALVTAAANGYPDDKDRVTVSSGFERKLLRSFGTVAEQRKCEALSAP